MSTGATRSDPRAARQGLAWFVAVATAVCCVVAQWGIDGNRRIDFRIYYRSVRSMGGGRLYDYGELATNFLYPPPAALLLRPLLLLGEDTASRVWLVGAVAVALAGFVAVLHLALGRGGRVPVWTAPVVAALCLWSTPALLSFRLGQINPVVGTLLCLDVVLIARSRRGAGVATGLAAAVKLTPVLALVLMAVGGRRTEARRGLVAFALASGITALFLPTETWRFWTDVVFDASGVGSAGSSLNAGLYSLTGLVTDIGAVQRGLWLVASIALAAVAFRRARALWSTDVVAAMTVAMCLTYAVSPLTWIHHQWFLAVAAVLWLDRARRPGELAVAAAGLIAALDPFGLGEESMLRTVVMVAFVVATVVALPPATDSPAEPELAQDGPSTPENRGAHV